jgi:biotin carboxyl carrier protein
MSRSLTLTVDGKSYRVVVDANTILVDGHPFVAGFDADTGRVLVDGTAYEVTVDGEMSQAVVGGIAHSLSVDGVEEARTRPERGTATVAGEGAVTAIMPGKIIRILVGEGDPVTEGDVICILEAMKMENELTAPQGGVVAKLHMRQGQDVEAGTVLAEIN